MLSFFFPLDLQLSSNVVGEVTSNHCCCLCKPLVCTRPHCKHQSVSLLQLEELAQQLTDPSLSYPDYYLRKFHAYESGNLDWKAVCELESATASLAVTVFKHEHLKPNVAEDAMRNSFLDALQVKLHNKLSSPLYDCALCVRSLCMY